MSVEQMSFRRDDELSNLSSFISTQEVEFDQLCQDYEVTDCYKGGKNFEFRGQFAELHLKRCLDRYLFQSQVARRVNAQYPEGEELILQNKWGYNYQVLQGNLIKAEFDGLIEINEHPTLIEMKISKSPHLYMESIGKTRLQKVIPFLHRLYPDKEIGMLLVCPAEYGDSFSDFSAMGGYVTTLPVHSHTFSDEVNRRIFRLSTVTVHPELAKLQVLLDKRQYVKDL